MLHDRYISRYLKYELNISYTNENQTPKYQLYQSNFKKDVPTACLLINITAKKTCELNKNMKVMSLFVHISQVYIKNVQIQMKGDD